MLLNFFCQIVDVVIAIKAITVAIKPNRSIFDPTSKPITKAAPMNPSSPPLHYLIQIFSFNIRPLSKFVKIDCNVTLHAALPAHIPIET